MTKVKSLEEELQSQKDLCAKSRESLLESQAQKEALEEQISELQEAVQVRRGVEMVLFFLHGM